MEVTPPLREKWDVPGRPTREFSHRLYPNSPVTESRTTYIRIRPSTARVLGRAHWRFRLGIVPTFLDKGSADGVGRIVEMRPDLRHRGLPVASCDRLDDPTVLAAHLVPVLEFFLQLAKRQSQFAEDGLEDSRRPRTPHGSHQCGME